MKFDISASVCAVCNNLLGTEVRSVKELYWLLVRRLIGNAICVDVSSPECRTANKFFEIVLEFTYFLMSLTIENCVHERAYKFGDCLLKLKMFHPPLCYLVRYFACCFVELWNLICPIEDAEEPCSRENIWTWEEGSDRRLKKIVKIVAIESGTFETIVVMNLVEYKK